MTTHDASDYGGPYTTSSTDHYQSLYRLGLPASPSACARWSTNSASEESVYFTLESFTTTIPNDFPDHQAIAQVYTRSTPPNASVSYALEVTQSFGSDGLTSEGQGGTSRGGAEEEVGARNLFAVEQQTGRIFLQQPVDARGNLTGWNFTLHISAWTRRENTGVSDLDPGLQALAVVTVNIAPSPPLCSCFGEASYVFRLRSDADSGPFGALWFDPQCLSANGASLKYSFLPEQISKGLYIDNQTSELVLIRHSDTPLQSRNLTVKCTAEHSARGVDQTRTESRVIAIQVEQVPDWYVISVRQNRSKGDHLVWIQTNDPRVQNWQTIGVSLAGKHQDAYAFIPTTSTPPTAALEQSSGKIIGELTLNRTFPWCCAARHSLTVYLRDGSQHGPANTSQSAHAQDVAVAVQIDIQLLKHVLNLTLHRNASLYTRVVDLEFPSCEPANALQRQPPTSLIQDGGLLRLEHSSLLVYVVDTSPLTNRSLTGYTAVVQRQVGWRGESLQAELVLQIEIIGERNAKQRPNCDLEASSATCSRHNAREDCVSACGIGAPDGRCRWREQQNTKACSEDFSTCSPDFRTCPDGVCDNLERLHPRLCPQDCIETMGANSMFSMTLNGNNVGIKSAIGPCSCDFDGLGCMCMHRRLPVNLQRHTTMLQQRVDPTTIGLVPYSLLTTVSPSLLVSQPDGSGTDECTYCNSLIAVVMAFLVLCAFAVLVYTRASRGSPLRRLFSSRDYKPPVVIGGSDSRLNSVLSECSDDGLHLSKGSVTRLKTEFDPKWEFPRRNLVLDKVLGEGEFGCVVRAQALSLRGHTGYTTVAVKMLKGSYSADDLQDLITEMNLLKDLSHPNVVKLLGASTQKGPLYVIVEYCRHGCLRDFLRRNRSTAVYQDDDASLHDYDKIHDEAARAQIVWNNRDLLSFAWQICKGMQYLAMLKLVHRDLAARNILVAEGMVIKVSDFGLARDLYESGTYVKTSKSRIPMKWMAPESLFDNIYTTKTDIWSFGVLFWEILTMGAMPYPGIMSHKLCQLIRQGYRLERPDGCAEELYNIMQKCWLSDPDDRPDFEVVGTMLERIMEKDADYLDLSCLPYGECSDAEGSNSAAEDSAPISSAVPLLQLPASDSTEIMPMSVSLRKDRHLTDDVHLKEIIVEEETNVDSGPLYGDMDTCRLYSNINNNFITDHLCKTASEPNLSSTSVFLE
ncbi:proto-oncogene tyrosine-protein kinase receptor Ret-like [Patiria miniata]|uniref:receptor protein-tyrosine kinase n=1 Tax=Patiria miniata TaxID=46514 RepID=A0A914A9K1_PATMI|nr:proto-oncogene tyrosine-protein kinase receptor Ret-like [Patiria miniata]